MCVVLASALSEALCICLFHTLRRLDLCMLWNDDPGSGQELMQERPCLSCTTRPAAAKLPGTEGLFGESKYPNAFYIFCSLLDGKILAGLLPRILYYCALLACLRLVMQNATEVRAYFGCQLDTDMPWIIFLNRENVFQVWVREAIRSSRLLLDNSHMLLGTSQRVWNWL